MHISIAVNDYFHSLPLSSWVCSSTRFWLPLVFICRSAGVNAIRMLSFTLSVIIKPLLSLLPSAAPHLRNNSRCCCHDNSFELKHKSVQVWKHELLQYSLRNIFFFFTKHNCGWKSDITLIIYFLSCFVLFCFFKYNNLLFSWNFLWLINNQFCQPQFNPAH